MYEICALLRQPKAKKPRKPAGPKIEVGKQVVAQGHRGTVVAKHPEFANWWIVEFQRPGGAQRFGFDRSVIRLV